MLRRIAKSLALRVPPVRRLYENALEANAENAVLRKRFAAANDERAVLSARAVAANAESTALRESVAKANAENAKLPESIGAANAENAKLQHEIQTRIGEVAELHKQLDLVRNELKGWRAQSALLQHRLEAPLPQPIAPPICPICAGTNVSTSGANTLHNGVATPVYACAVCSHKFVHPLPTPEEVASWYQGMKYYVDSRTYQNIGTDELSDQWNGFVGDRMKALRAHVIERFGLRGNLRIGEIGCLEGAFLKKLSLDGHQVIGFEVNADVIEMSRRTHGIDIRCVNIEEDEVAVTGLDVITSFHTFEHLRSPARVLVKAAAMLRDGGVILLEVPCDDDEMDNEDHFQFFCAGSLRRLLEAEFTDVELFPNQYLRDGNYCLGSLYGVGRRRFA